MLKEQEVYVPIRVDNEKNPSRPKVFVDEETIVISEGMACLAYWQEHRVCMAGYPQGSRGQGFVDTYNKLPIDVTHWLEPQSKILLSKDELREFADKIWRESRRRANYDNCDDRQLVYGDQLPPPDFDQFINQLLGD